MLCSIRCYGTILSMGTQYDYSVWYVVYCCSRTCAESTSGVGTMVTIASSVVIHPKDGDPTQYGDQGQRS